MLITVVYYHTLLAMSNMTSIEDKKGIKLCFGITDTILLVKERHFNVFYIRFTSLKNIIFLNEVEFFRSRNLRKFC